MPNARIATILHAMVSMCITAFCSTSSWSVSSFVFSTIATRQQRCCYSQCLSEKNDWIHHHPRAKLCGTADQQQRNSGSNKNDNDEMRNDSSSTFTITDEEQNNYTTIEENNERRMIRVLASIELPFSASVAYDAFSDLPRQPSWTPLLSSVIYTTSVMESRWTMVWKQWEFSWNAQTTLLEPPHQISWQSTSGLKNRGNVSFTQSDSPNQQTTTTTTMTLSLEFVAPRVVALLFRQSLLSTVERTIVLPTLLRFRDVVTNEDLT